MKKQEIFAITCTQRMLDGRANVKLHSAFKSEKDAKDMFDALKYGYIQNGDSISESEEMPNHMSVMSDCWTLDYQIIRGSVLL